MNRRRFTLCAGLALLVHAGGVHAESQALATFQQPRHQGLVDPGFPVSATVPAQPGEGWHLLAQSLEGNGLDTLVTGYGPWDGTTAWQVGPLANGPWRLRLEVLAAGGTQTVTRDVLVGRPQQVGFPKGEALVETGFHTQPMAETSAGRIAWVEGIAVQGIRGVPQILNVLDASGATLPGFPRDLIHDGVETGRISSPVWLHGTGVESIALLAQTRLLRFSLAGGTLGSYSFTGEAATELLCYHTPDGQPRLLFASNSATGSTLHLLDGELNPLWISGFASQVQGATLPIALADLDGDLQPEGWLALYSAGADLGQLLRVDLNTGQGTLFGSIPGFVPAQLLSGEITGDLSTDLILSGNRDMVSAWDNTGLLWLATCPGRSLSLGTLADVTGDRRQEFCFTDFSDQTQTRLRVIDGSGQPACSIDGLELGLNQRLGFEPLVADMNGDGQRDFVLASALKDPVVFHGQVRVFDLSGTQLDRWAVAGRPTSPLRLRDLDGDGVNELMLTDTFNRLNVWQTQSSDPTPGLPMGDTGRSGRSLQVVGQNPEGNLWLEGQLLVGDSLVIAAGQVLGGDEISFVGGTLVVQGALDLTTGIHVGQHATLILKDGAVMQNPGTQLDIVGTLRLQGVAHGPGVSPLMPSPLGNILNQVQLGTHAQARIELVDCTLQGLDHELELGPGQELLLQGAWLLNGKGIRLQGASLVMDHSLMHGDSSSLELLEGSVADIRHSTFSSSGNRGLHVVDSQVELRHTYMLNNQLGIDASGNGSLLADSCHFQANGTALRVGGNGFAVQASHSDFVDCGGPAVVNQGQVPLQAMYCHWSGSAPNVGPVLVEPANLQPFYPPETTAPVWDIRPGPMINGDEPLLAWDPVEYTLNGIPVIVRYRVYRSTEPYDLVHPENMVATVDAPCFYDSGNPARVFYAVTVWLGKSSD